MSTGEAVQTGWILEWPREAGVLRIIEPTPAELEEHAGALAAFYNQPDNQRLLANTMELVAADVVEFYRETRAGGGHPMLLWWQGVLMGDADLRRVDGEKRTAEFAILIGEREKQGRGFGTRFAAMAHLFGFATLGLERIYVSLVADNAGSRRLFEKLGHEPDDSPAARACADDPTDVTLSCTRARFEAKWAHPLGGLRVGRRMSTDG
jgi:RimJ/RimL family protein N-acetyltransferase